MARVALIFLFAFCVFHISSAAPLDQDAATKGLEEGLKSLQDMFEKTFTKENMEKFQSGLTEFGQKLGEQSKALMDKASEEFKKLQEKDKVPVQ